MGKRPVQSRIPGTENSIAELDKLGADYAEIRDERQGLLTQEVELKKKVRAAMHKHNLKEYKYGRVTIVLEPGEEEVKVKIKEIPDQD